MKPYLFLPTFVIDKEKSAYEGETFHTVGDMEHCGDYHFSFANSLMRQLILEYCLRLEEAAGPEEVEKFLENLR